MKTKQQWLLQFRRYANEETLYKIADRINKKLSGDEYANFQLAVDHRLAEISMNTLYNTKFPLPYGNTFVNRE